MPRLSKHAKHQSGFCSSLTWHQAHLIARVSVDCYVNAIHNSRTTLAPVTSRLKRPKALELVN